MPACAREMKKAGGVMWPNRKPTYSKASFFLLFKFKTKTSSDQSDSVVQQHGNVIEK